jgi:hypothetical protein
MPETSGEQPDLVHEAVAELYWSDPADFVERRGVLVAQARAAGQAPAAKSIAALRKPTRSAWVVNRLIRSDPDVTSRLVRLGDELRAAQGSLDGAAIRELSARRRQLVAELSRQAFAASGLQSPPAAVRDEVNATLGAALADPQLAGQLAAGTLERPAQAEGFLPTAGPADPAGPAGTAGPAGPAGAPVLTVLAGGRQAQAPDKAAPRPARRGTAQERAEAAAQARAEAAAREQAERERRRQAALAEADQAVAEADQSAAAASTAELDLEAAVERLEQELADARQGLTDARLAARRARNRQRQARQARDRLDSAAARGDNPPKPPRIR